MPNTVRYVVTTIRFEDSDNKNHEGISEVKVVDKTGATASKWMTVEDAYDFSDSNDLWVEGPSKTVICYRRETAAGHKYIQTKADGVWSDNLLSLPEG